MLSFYGLSESRYAGDINLRGLGRLLSSFLELTPRSKKRHFNKRPCEIIQDNMVFGRAKELWGQECDWHSYQNSDTPDPLHHRNTKRENFKQNTSIIVFCFLKLFQGLLNGYLGKLRHVDLFGFFS